jgi:hypothetical protein
MRPTSTLTAESVLAAARRRHAAATKAEIDKLQLAVEWVLLHPGDEVDTSVEWGMRELEIAGDGAPTIEEGAVAEFALAIGVSTDAGRGYLGDAVELCYRLPRTWARVIAGEVATWKARRIAQATRSLPPEGADHVDRHLSFVAHRCSFAKLEELVEKARAEFDPAETERRRLREADRRRFTFHWRAVTSSGLVPFSGLCDLADALSAEDAIAARAAALDPELPLDVRRSMALGLLGGGAADGPAQRELVVYAHVRPDQSMVEVENTRSVVTPEQLRAWCQAAGTTVTVRPVIDLNDTLTTTCYQPTERISEQVRLRHHECVFPSCHRPSRSCDLDHVIPWPIGPTTSWNLAPLCRGHHRLKTHTDWDYHWVPGVGFVWTDPSGHRHIN